VEELPREVAAVVRFFVGLKAVLVQGGWMWRRRNRERVDRKRTAR
jgi:hypothetical protein